MWRTICHFELLKSLWIYVVTYLCVGQPGAPPPPPPPGSMPGATTLSKSYTSRVRLPMLNWTVVKNITKTVFEELNDKRIVSTLNFREFETLFEARKQSTFEKPGETLHLKLILSVYSYQYPSQYPSQYPNQYPSQYPDQYPTSILIVHFFY